jgi:hypothetical protein
VIYYLALPDYDNFPHRLLAEYLHELHLQPLDTMAVAALEAVVVADHIHSLQQGQPGGAAGGIVADAAAHVLPLLQTEDENHVAADIVAVADTQLQILLEAAVAEGTHLDELVLTPAEPKELVEEDIRLQVQVAVVADHIHTLPQQSHSDDVAGGGIVADAVAAHRQLQLQTEDENHVAVVTAGTHLDELALLLVEPNHLTEEGTHLDELVLTLLLVEPNHLAEEGIHLAAPVLVLLPLVEPNHLAEEGIHLAVLMLAQNLLSEYLQLEWESLVQMLQHMGQLAQHQPHQDLLALPPLRRLDQLRHYHQNQAQILGHTCVQSPLYSWAQNQPVLVSCAPQLQGHFFQTHAAGVMDLHELLLRCRLLAVQLNQMMDQHEPL